MTPCSEVFNCRIKFSTWSWACRHALKDSLLEAMLLCSTSLLTFLRCLCHWPEMVVCDFCGFVVKLLITVRQSQAASGQRARIVCLGVMCFCVFGARVCVMVELLRQFHSCPSIHCVYFTCETDQYLFCWFFSPWPLTLPTQGISPTGNSCAPCWYRDAHQPGELSSFWAAS